MKRYENHLFIGALIFGLGLRIAALFFNGMQDLVAYYNCGMSALTDGLSASYRGGYFPIQYQLFEFYTWVSLLTRLEYFVVFKFFSLCFEIGNMLALLAIFRKLGISKYYLLFYWIHPWFLNFFSLGYIDNQFTFFILVSVYYLLDDGKQKYLASSFFLGCAFLMKPQALIVLVAFFLYAFFLLYKRKDEKPMLLFVFPAGFFLAYTLYFFVFYTGQPKWLGLISLFSCYLNVSNVIPCLNANFLNGWYIVAYFLKDNLEPIYTVTDRMTIAHLQVKYLAFAVVLAIVAAYAALLTAKHNESPRSINFILLACFSSIVLPFIMTSAHENHLFMSTVLFLIVLGKTRHTALRVLINIMLLLQFINLNGYYGVVGSSLFPALYTQEVAVVLSVVSVVSFLGIVYYFFTARHTQVIWPAGPPE